MHHTHFYTENDGEEPKRSFEPRGCYQGRVNVVRALCSWQGAALSGSEASVGTGVRMCWGQGWAGFILSAAVCVKLAQDKPNRTLLWNTVIKALKYITYVHRQQGYSHTVNIYRLNKCVDNTYAHTYIHTHTNAHIHTLTHKHTHKLTHTLTHKHTHTQTHTHTGVRASTHTHTHTDTFFPHGNNGYAKAPQCYVCLYSSLIL